ncbi:FAD:protein FMN transferase [Biformimicrobium ophioploci]|uniref:FAD:protein FMN transferase n=1 Tax=Biformimicrobium ophioploci TaxID=3036711 RepID=A0ABQ6M1C7_9GAMM|nr:FAD:protein FMN transferase [Microbulbifer sp. NKW57]GMG88084.1 FAD:protein FMN transferase [Microbulbifer sp. NKW57]
MKLYPSRIVAAACLILHSLVASAEWHYDSQPVMGTEVTVQFWLEDSGSGGQAAAALVDAAMAEFRRIDRRYSPYREDSELSRVNREAASGPVEISAEFVQIIDKALWFSAQTEGAFDITFASVGRHYDFREGSKPDTETTAAARGGFDFRNLQLDRAARTLRFAHPSTRIDLGGIAKGYAVDRVVDLLATAGVKHARVSAGGDSRLIGDKRGEPWVVGVRHPRDKSKNVVLLPLENTAISTSGDYERYFILEGRRLHHIFDPETAEPTEEGDDKLIAVTVLGEKAFDTDPLSTSLFVLGREKGLALVNRLDGVEAMVIGSDRKVYFSRGLEQLPASKQ